ncbi:MAG: DUF3568 family protein [Candidatus Omnitrophota bacterium]
MVTKIAAFVFSGILFLNLYGCVAVVAGTAGGAGTSIWLSGKLTQEFHAPYDRTVSAAEDALASLRLELMKSTREENITQLKSKYTDGKEIWIDIRKITMDSTKVEVRVGAVHPDKTAADKILKKIKSYL